ncbi:MAG: hypothetical protein GC184_00240 [Rhizobiales bacterium]|nr:hypothetical protein [Hyphomicrobiales bacterium]
MLFALIKAGLSGLIILAISEIAKRSPAFAALIASLPLLSLLAVIWLWNETGDGERIAAHLEATFWYVLPSLPLFLVMPWLLRSGAGFWPALGLSAAMTFLLYLGTIWLAARFGIRL